MALVVVLSSVVLAVHTSPNTIYVDDDCVETVAGGDGSLADSYCTIQNAVDHAEVGLPSHREVAPLERNDRYDEQRCGDADQYRSVRQVQTVRQRVRADVVVERKHLL